MRTPSLTLTILYEAYPHSALEVPTTNRRFCGLNVNNVVHSSVTVARCDGLIFPVSLCSEYIRAHPLLPMALRELYELRGRLEGKHMRNRTRMRLP